MVRPANFGFNPETADNNAFQKQDKALNAKEVQVKALSEFEGMVESLRNHDIHVEVFEDTSSPVKPDAIFPNNWVSTHANGAILTYPLMSALRRPERREDIVEALIEKFDFTRRYSLEQYEEKELFLESTGSLVLDRVQRVAYACLSIRTDPSVLDKFCALMGYDRVIFRATDESGTPIYHTNVMMSIGSELAMVCFDCIKNPEEQNEIRSRLERSGRTILPISMAQMHAFAGNMLELQREEAQNVLVMSTQAFRSLEPDQVATIREFCEPLYTPLDTIELHGGGSARCMIAEVFRPSVS